jgi:sulfur-oxidizing protein SoxY
MLNLYAVVLGAAVVASAAAPDPRDRAYDAKTVDDAQALLGVQSPEPGKKVLLEVPDIVDGSPKTGAAVRVKLTSTMPGTDWMALLLERGSKPLVVYQDFSPGTDRVLEAELNLMQTTRVRALVRVAGKYYIVSREVKVAKPIRDVR